MQVELDIIIIIVINRSYLVINKEYLLYLCLCSTNSQIIIDTYIINLVLNLNFDYLHHYLFFIIENLQ